MIRPDLITCWPRAHDYPLWRSQVARDRDKLGQVFIVFTSDNIYPDTRDFVRGVLPWASLLDTEAADDGAWYDDALKTGLRASTAEWVWITEQDFFYTASFLDAMLAAAHDYDMVCADEGRKTDPSCCLVRRSVIEQTTRGFSARHDELLDNFEAFSAEVRGAFRWTSLESLGLTEMQHMRGLSHNHYLIANGWYDRVYEPAALRTYFEKCLAVGGGAPSWNDHAARFIAWYDARSS